MDFGRLELYWNGPVPFLVLQTVSIGNPCFSVIAWIHVCMIQHKENTNAMQPTKAYDTKHIDIVLGVHSMDNWSQSF